MKPETEDKADLQERFDSAQRKLNRYAREVQDLKSDIEELKTNEALLDEQRQWLWAQLQMLAQQGMNSSKVLMIIEPEHAKSSWEYWTLQNGGWIAEKATLLLTGKPFKLRGHEHCKFNMKWLTGTSRIDKVKEREPEYQFTRSYNDTSFQQILCMM